MNKLFAIAVIAVVAALTAPESAWTCDCMPPPPVKESFAQSVAVFSAKVVKIEEDATSGKRLVTLKIDRWWKGGDSSTLVVVTNKNGASCGFGFQPDTSYLIYARAEQGRKELVVHLCSRTRTLAQAEQSGDLKELGEGKAPKK